MLQATAAAARLGHLLRLIADYAPLLLGDPRPPAATLWAADLGALRHNLTRLSVALVRCLGPAAAAG